jgi:ubiquinone/menaquinone biosynthesis C-methylase UbiE
LRAVQFTGAAESYDRFMGRYTPSLAVALADAAGVHGDAAGVRADAAGVRAGMQVLDVGSGPGGLTHELAARVGAANVAAIDPAAQFVAACRERNPGADVREGVAEELPWPDGAFDAVLSSLVLGFMRDADQGVREMVRVTRPGGTVAVCMWDIATGGMTMLRVYWDAVRQVVPAAQGERRMAGVAEGDIAERFRRAGINDVADGVLTAHADYASFEDFWQPFTFGVGPSGQYLLSLPPEQQEAVREAVRAELAAAVRASGRASEPPAGDGSFTLSARSWYARGTTPT